MTTALFHKDTELSAIKEKISKIEEQLENFTKEYKKPFFAMKGLFVKREVEYKRTKYGFYSYTGYHRSILMQLKELELFINAAKSVELSVKDFLVIHDDILPLKFDDGMKYCGIKKSEDEDETLIGSYGFKIEGAYTKDT